MGWIGAGLGYLCGNAFGGVLGGIVGAVVGSMLEGRGKEADGPRRSDETPGRGAQDARSQERELVFLAAAAAMMAKLAKADGRIDMSEINSAEAAFRRLGLSHEKREYCIRVFRKAKSDSHTIFEYAAAFADAQPDSDIREIFYDILWDLACADGVLTEAELDILRRIIPALRIRPFFFSYEYARRHSGARGRAGGRGRPRAAQPDPSLAEAYATLGCGAHASDAEVRKAYRAKALKLHPDELQARGVSPELVAKATDQMARVNAAWAAVKKARGI